jgi:hypothetical protein
LIRNGQPQNKKNVLKSEACLSKSNVLINETFLINRHVFSVVKCSKNQGFCGANKRTKNEKLKRRRWYRVTALHSELDPNSNFAAVS